MVCVRFQQQKDMCEKKLGWKISVRRSISLAIHFQKKISIFRLNDRHRSVFVIFIEKKRLTMNISPVIVVTAILGYLPITKLTAGEHELIPGWHPKDCKE